MAGTKPQVLIDAGICNTFFKCLTFAAAFKPLWHNVFAVLFWTKLELSPSCHFHTLRVRPTCPAHWSCAPAIEFWLQHCFLIPSFFFLLVSLSLVSGLFHSSPWNFTLYLFAHFQVCSIFVGFFLFFSSFMFKIDAYVLLVLQCFRFCCTCAHIANTLLGAFVRAFALKVGSCKRKSGQKITQWAFFLFPWWSSPRHSCCFFSSLVIVSCLGYFLKEYICAESQLEDSSLSVQADIFTNLV